MSTTVRKEAGWKLPEEGEHLGRGYKVEKVRTRNGCRVMRVVFHIISGNDAGLISSALLNGFYPDSLLDQWTRSVLSEDVSVGAEVDIEDLLNKPCIIEVKHHHQHGKTYANVVRISRLR